VGLAPVPDDTGSVAISPHAPSINDAMPIIDAKCSRADPAMKGLLLLAMIRFACFIRDAFLVTIP
jgi:hypothetical protein